MSEAPSPLPELDKALAAVRQQIREAFADTPQPHAGELVDSYWLGGVESTDASEKAREARLEQSLMNFQSAFAGKKRDDLDSAFWAGSWAYGCYFSPKADRYYLPSLLLRSLDPFSTGNSLLHATVYSLNPDYWSLYNEGPDSPFNDRPNQFPRPEYEAVCAFLGLVFDHLPEYSSLAAKALRWGWNGHETAALTKVRRRYELYHHFEGYEPSTDPTIRALVEEIAEAFKETPYPGDRNLIKNPSHCEEEAELALELAGHPWQKLHPELLMQNEDCLHLFSPEGFRFILPAYLLLDLHGQGRNNDPVFSLTYELGGPPPERADSSSEIEASGKTEQRSKLEDLRPCLKPFRRKERQAIIAYLRLRANRDEFERPGIERALENYWMGSLEE
jgi:hypothetical protein